MNSKIVKLCSLGVILLCSLNLKAQTKEYSGAWHTLVLKHELSSKFTLSNELHVRRTQFYKSWQQLLLRPAVAYKLTSNVTLAAGYTFITNYSEYDKALEHNVWEDVILKNEVKTIKISHRFRFEQRFAQAFNSETYAHSNRLRYRLTLKKVLFNIKEDKPVSGTVFNEIWLNTGNGIQPKSINQNWFYAGLSLPVKPHITFSMGYLHVDLPQNNEDSTKHHILQLGVSAKI